MGCSQSTPVQEPAAAAAPASNASGVAAPSSAPASQTSAAAPTSHASKTSDVQSAPSSGNAALAPASAAKLFAVTGVTITEQGVVYYNIDRADGGAALKKRYNDFKELYAKLPNATLLPVLPSANLSTLFRGKHNTELLQEREQQLEVVLNAIGNNAAFAGTDEFQKFLVE